MRRDGSSVSAALENAYVVTGAGSVTGLNPTFLSNHSLSTITETSLLCRRKADVSA